MPKYMNWFVACVFLSVCNTHVCMYEWQFIHSWRPEVDFRCFLLFLSAGTGSLTDLGARGWLYCVAKGRYLPSLHHC